MLYCYNETHVSSIFQLINLIIFSSILIARAFTITPECHHIIPVLKNLHWLTINQRVHYNILSLVYKSLLFNQPTYLCSLITVQPAIASSSAAFCIYHSICPSVASRLLITNRSLFYIAHALWNRLPTALCHISLVPTESTHFPKAP
jgi:hypothetical protein